MKREQVKVILVEPYFDLKTPDAIARDTGAKVVVLAPSVGGTKEATDYITLFDYNLGRSWRQSSTPERSRPRWTLTVLEFLAAPFAASLILTGIHAYLGVHVVERGVIFVDLSLAQIAALGGDRRRCSCPGPRRRSARPSVYWVSLGFTFIGAAVFSLTHARRARIPQEAIIGISYAVASAAAILAMSKSTSQAEHLKDMLVGNILAVSWAAGDQDRGALRRRRGVPLRLPPPVPAHLDGPRPRPKPRACRCGSGISSSTPRSASSSPRRSRSPACCSCSAT